MSTEVNVEVLSARDEVLGSTLASLRDFVSLAGRNAGLAPRAIYNLKLAVDEIATNIVMYAYPDSTEDDLITVTSRIYRDHLEITLEDTGIPYNPRAQHTPVDLNTPLEDREIGGLGIFFALNNVDEFHYHYEDACNQNQFIMYRPLTRAQPESGTQILFYTHSDQQRVREHLTDAGYTVHHSASQHQHIKWINQDQHDLLIIDKGVPYKEVFHFLKLIRITAGNQDMPVLVLGEDGVYISRCMELGATDFLITPLDPLLLEARIRVVIRQSQGAIKKRIQKLAQHIKNIFLSDRPELRFGRNMQIDHYLEHVLDEVQGMYRADAGTVYLKTDDNTLHFAVMQTHSLNLKAGGSAEQHITMPTIPLYEEDGKPNHHNVSAHVVHTGETVNIRDIYESREFDFSGTRWFDQHNHYRSISTLTVPLRDHNDEVLGVIQLINAQDETGHVIPFDVSQQMLVEALSAYTAVILSNYRLLQRQAVLSTIENDLRIGRQIQRDFMPATIPEIAGWSIDARFYPAREIAGDFYDIFVMGEYAVFILADVCDKGVGAALFMALIRSLLRAFISQARESMIALPPQMQTPIALMTEIRKVVQNTNDYIIEHHYELTMFATLFLGVVNTQTGRMYYINGGHSPTPILQRGKDGRIERLNPTGPAVGMFGEAWFEVKQVSIRPGDLLFAFTDGVNDAHNRHGELLGEADVIEMVRSATSVDDLLTQVSDRVFNQIGSSVQFDDMTFWALSRDRAISAKRMADDSE
ncbi:MAG: SpoIIE family protein phosphatase [Anaerolineae bacterium]